jgi:hypothetical protein
VDVLNAVGEAAAIAVGLLVAGSALAMLIMPRRVPGWIRARTLRHRRQAVAVGVLYIAGGCLQMSGSIPQGGFGWLYTAASALVLVWYVGLVESDRRRGCRRHGARALG